MPLHVVPALTRRQFIRRTLAGSAALLTMRQAQAAPDASRWALLSDTHIAGDPATVAREVNLAEHLRAAVAEIGAQKQRPAGLMINGDCSLGVGLPEDYTTLTALLKPLADTRLPLHFTLGNHDHRDVFRAALAGSGAGGAPPLLVAKHVSVIQTALANWILLDSLEIVNKTPGSLGEEQRAWLVKILDARPDKPALLMLHHNPINDNPEKRTGLLDAAELLEIVLPRRQVKAVFFGHTHRWSMAEQEGVHFVNLPAVAYVFRPTEPSGWVDCRLERDRARLELRAIGGAHPAHGEVKELLWRP